MTDSDRRNVPVAGRRRRSVRLEIAPKSLLIAVLVVAAGWLLIRLAPALMVLLVALMIVGTLGPAVRSLQARGLGRRSAIVLM